MSIGRRGFLAGVIAAAFAPLAALLPKRSNAVAIAGAKILFPSSCLVKITGRLEGGGKYAGTLMRVEASGEFAQGETVAVINLSEIGKHSHALTVSDEFQTVFPAVFVKASDLPVYAISGLQVMGRA